MLLADDGQVKLTYSVDCESPFKRERDVSNQNVCWRMGEHGSIRQALTSIEGV